MFRRGLSKIELQNVSLLATSNKNVKVKILLMHYGAWEFMESPNADTSGGGNVEPSETVSAKDITEKTVLMIEQMTW